MSATQIACSRSYFTILLSSTQTTLLCKHCDVPTLSFMLLWLFEKNYVRKYLLAPVSQNLEIFQMEKEQNTGCATLWKVNKGMKEGKTALLTMFNMEDQVFIDKLAACEGEGLRMMGFRCAPQFCLPPMKLQQLLEMRRNWLIFFKLDHSQLRYKPRYCEKKNT